MDNQPAIDACELSRYVAKNTIIPLSIASHWKSGQVESVAEATGVMLNQWHQVDAYKRWGRLLFAVGVPGQDDRWQRILQVWHGQARPRVVVYS